MKSFHRSPTAGNRGQFGQPKSRQLQHHEVASRPIFYTCIGCICAILILIQTQTFQIVQKTWNPGYHSAYNKENKNHNWCPNATCNNSPLCQPCKRRFLIVIATGRSGSTTLTNMLDLLPNVRMAGENNGHLRFGLYAAENLQITEQFKLEYQEEVVGAWKHHPIPKQSHSCPIQQMFEVINPPPEEKLMRRKGYDDSDTIIGFKTVRLHGEDMFPSDWKYVADYLLENFPCARFVFNIRGDVERQVQSWMDAFGTELDGDEIRYYNRKLEMTAAYMGQDRARLLDMREWSKKDNSGVVVLNELIEWLGFLGCKYDSLLHSNKGGYGVDRQQVSLGKNCRYRGN